MSLNRYAKRRDTNEDDLVVFAKGCGIELVKTDKPLDWLAGWRGQWVPTEIKRPDKEGHADEFTDAQRLFITRARDCRLPVWVWRTSDDVLRSIGARRSA